MRSKSILLFNNYTNKTHFRLTQGEKGLILQLEEKAPLLVKEVTLCFRRTALRFSAVVSVLRFASAIVVSSVTVAIVAAAAIVTASTMEMAVLFTLNGFV